MKKNRIWVVEILTGKKLNRWLPTNAGGITRKDAAKLLAAFETRNKDDFFRVHPYESVAPCSKS